MTTIQDFVAERLSANVDVDVIAQEAQTRFPTQCAGRNYILMLVRTIRKQGSASHERPVTITLTPAQSRAMRLVMGFMDGSWEDDADILDKLDMTPCEWGDLVAKFENQH